MTEKLGWGGGTDRMHRRVQAPEFCSFSSLMIDCPTDNNTLLSTKMLMIIISVPLFTY